MTRVTRSRDCRYCCGVTNAEFRQKPEWYDLFIDSTLQRESATGLLPL